MDATACKDLSNHVQLAVNYLKDDHGYQSISVLGKGTYGSVLKVKRGKSEYAAKIVERRMINQMEIMMWPHLKHRNVLRLIHSVADSGNTVVFLTDLMNMNLLQRLNSHDFREDPSALERCRTYVKQVFHGMSYLHRKNMCHLDLRADNVFLSIGDDRAVVGDFSGLCWADAERRFCPLPLALRPPEMLSGRKKAWPIPVDLWTCGLLLASVFMGKGFYACTIKNKRAGHMDAVREYTSYFQCEVYVKTFISKAYHSCHLAEHSLRFLINLLGRLLRMNPGHRLSVDDALKHPFLSTHLGVLRTDLGPVQEDNPLPGIVVQGVVEEEKLSRVPGSEKFQVTVSEAEKNKLRLTEAKKVKVSRWTRLKTRLMRLRWFTIKSSPSFGRIRFKSKKKKDNEDRDIPDNDKD